MKIFLTVCAIVGFWFLMSLFQENVPVLRGAAFHVADQQSTGSKKTVMP